MICKAFLIIHRKYEIKDLQYSPKSFRFSYHLDKPEVT